MSEAVPIQVFENEQALFQRLADGHTLVTANRAQARIVQQRYQAWRLSAQASRWRSPRILPLTAWIDELWEEASLEGAPGTDSIVPGPRQVQSSWESILRDSPPARDLLQAGMLAAELMSTRRLAVEWNVPLDGAAWTGDELGNPAAFRRWNRAFENRCRQRGWLPPEDRPAVLAAALSASGLSINAPLDLLGFEEFSPVLQQLLAELQASGLSVSRFEPEAGAADTVLWRAADSEAELRHMALTVRRWLRDDPGARIAVIVHDLAERRAEIENQLSAILTPDSEAAGAAPPWNVSAGIPLLRHPMILAAFDWFALARRQTDIQQVSRVLRSPWLAGAGSERSQRALLERHLRDRFTLELRSNEVWYQAAMHPDQTAGDTEPAAPAPWKCPKLADMLDALNRELGDVTRRRPPSEWAETLDAMLRACGWPASESAGYRQALHAWHQCLGELASLDSTVTGYTRDQAVAELRQICRERVYANGGPPAPIQVLAPHEARGLSFDYAWVTGLDAENWPPPARPNPYIPARLQNELGLPQASPQRQLETAKRLTRNLACLAARCIFSFADRADAEQTLPSPLLAHFEALETTDLQTVPGETWDERLMAEPGPILDPLGSPGALAPGAARGGSRLLQHQSLCPFRAFVAHRLGAEPLQTPASGVSPRLHGSLLHRTLELFWSETANQAALVALDRETLEARVGGCVKKALDAEPGLRFRDSLSAIEARRLLRHVMQYLELERAREPFEIARLEELVEPEIAGQPIRLFIDRVDRLADGSEIIIDYKTGKVHPGHWFTDRPEDPQLPLYAVAAGDAPAAVAFAVIREDGCEFKGISTREGLLPGLPPPRTRWSEALVAAGENMPQTIADWREVLHGLVADFLAGNARIDPRNGRRTCAQTWCEFQSLCRIDELDPAHAVDSEDLE